MARLSFSFRRFLLALELRGANGSSDLSDSCFDLSVRTRRENNSARSALERRLVDHRRGLLIRRADEAVVRSTTVAVGGSVSSF